MSLLSQNQGLPMNWAQGFNPVTHSKRGIKGGAFKDIIPILMGPTGWIYLAGKKKGRKEGKKQALEEIKLQDEVNKYFDKQKTDLPQAGFESEFPFYDPDMPAFTPEFPEFDPNPTDVLPEINPFTNNPEPAPPPPPPRINLQPVAPTVPVPPPAPPPPAQVGKLRTQITPTDLQSVHLRPVQSSDTALRINPQEKQSIVTELTQNRPVLRHVTPPEPRVIPAVQPSSQNDLMAALMSEMSKRRPMIAGDTGDEGWGYRRKKRQRRY